MFDMISSIRNSKKGDIITLKGLTRSEGYIVDSITRLFFQFYDSDSQVVLASLDEEGTKAFNISIRTIKQINKPTGEFIYRADPRDIVYGH